MDLRERVLHAVRARNSVNEPIWKLIKEVKKADKISENERNHFLGILFASLSDKDIIETLANDAMDYGAGTSFRSSINSLQRKKQRLQVLGLDIFPGDNPKLKDRNFASSLGVPVPRTYFESVPLDEIELLPNSILKPVEGVASKGVFFVTESGDLRSIKTSQTYSSIADASEEINRYAASISTDSWILEEAILNDSNMPANDFKVFSFYGVAGMFLEIDRFLESETRYATYTESGRQIERGPNYKSFVGSGIPDGIREMSYALSIAAPVPFLRLDFHYGDSGLYLGEITPRPGGTYAGDQFEEIDRMLGDHFADAEARLYADLLNGKKFPAFRAAYGVD